MAPRNAAQKSILLNLPLLNFFTQVVLYQPSLDTLEKLLGDIILFSTLLLVVVYGLPGMVDHAQLVEADERFGFNATYPDGVIINGESAWWDIRQSHDNPPSYSLGAFTVVSGFCLSLVFFGSVFQKIALSYATIMITDMEEDGNPDAKVAWRRWCYLNCVIFLLLLAFLGAGMVYFYFEIFVLCVVKWPDYGLQGLPTSKSYSASELSEASTVYEDLWAANLLLIVPIIGLFVLCSIANFLVHGYYRRSTKRVSPIPEPKAEV